MSQLGDTKESEVFKITLAGVTIDAFGDSEELSRCHSSLLEVILEAAFAYQQLADLEQFIHAGILEWLDTLQVLDCGLGLSLIPATRELSFSACISTTTTGTF